MGYPVSNYEKSSREVLMFYWLKGDVLMKYQRQRTISLIRFLFFNRKLKYLWVSGIKNIAYRFTFVIQIQ